MAQRLYTEGKQKVFEATFNWVTDTVHALLLPSSYVFDATDEFISDVGTITARVALSNKTNTDGVLDCDDPEFVAVAAGSIVGSIVYAKYTGVDATSPLLFHDDEAGGLPYTTNGGNIKIALSASGLLTIDTTMN
jgi:hypothetical protein